MCFGKDEDNRQGEGETCKSGERGRENLQPKLIQIDQIDLLRKWPVRWTVYILSAAATTLSTYLTYLPRKIEIFFFKKKGVNFFFFFFLTMEKIWILARAWMGSVAKRGIRHTCAQLVCVWHWVFYVCML